MKLPKYTLLGLGALLPVAGLVLAAKAPQDTKATRVARGKYLVTIIGCSDCHTPVKMGPKGPEPDLSRYLSGHPANANFPPAKAGTGSLVRFCRRIHCVVRPLGHQLFSQPHTGQQYRFGDLDGGDFH